MNFATEDVFYLVSQESLVEAYHNQNYKYIFKNLYCVTKRIIFIKMLLCMCHNMCLHIKYLIIYMTC